MAYNHGVEVREVPTSILAPVNVDSAITFAVGTAPKQPGGIVICYTYQEAVEKLGFSEDFAKYTLSEVIYTHFVLNKVSPVIFYNVIPGVNQTLTETVTEGKIVFTDPVSSITAIKNGTTDVPEEAYSIDIGDNGALTIAIVDDTAAPEGAALTIEAVVLDQGETTKEDIINGIGKIEEVFPKFRVIPSLLIAPGWSHESDVAAVMDAATGNINSVFQGISIVDIAQDASYENVPLEKTSSNISSENQIVCYPKVKLGEKEYNLSSQIAALIAKVDGINGGIPYESPSNKNLQADSAVLAGGEELLLGIDKANYLNSQGIVTALNFVGGWRAWGNNTACYPANTDVKDRFIAIKRMFKWISNTIVLTFWQKLDKPANRRLVDSILDTVNIWLNGLTASGYLLGGKVEFAELDNPATNVLDGKFTFHLYITPPIPAKELVFLIEFDVDNLNNLT